MRINRHLHSPFWTSEKDALLRKLENAGASAKQIEARLGVTPRSLRRRSLYLRGATIPANWQREELRAKTAKLREKKRRRTKGVLDAMQSAMARGTARDAAIMKALARGAGPQAIAQELGVSRQLVYRTIWGGATEQELRAIGQRRKKEKRDASMAIVKLRAAIARGAPRDAAIMQARKAGASYAAIGKVFGLTRQRVHQIVLLEQ